MNTKNNMIDEIADRYLKSADNSMDFYLAFKDYGLTAFIDDLVIYQTINYVLTENTGTEPSEEELSCLKSYIEYELRHCDLEEYNLEGITREITENYLQALDNGEIDDVNEILSFDGPDLLFYS